MPHYDSFIVGCFPRQQLIPPQALEHLGHRIGTAAPYPVLLVDGVVAGLWSRKQSGKRLVVTVDAFQELTKRQREELGTRAERIAAFLGLEPTVSFGHVEARAHL